MIELIAGYIVINLILASLVVQDARKWNMDATDWFLVVFFFSFLGLIIYLLSRNSEDNPKKRVKKEIVNSTFKKCPQCAEDVKEEAKICRFCRFEFNSSKSDKTIDKHFPQQLTISAECSEVFKEKNNRGEVLKTLNKDSSVKALEIEGEFKQWIKIDLGNSNFGYILRYDIE